MNSQDFTHILQNPQSISSRQTEAIKSVIDKFPYIQSARAVYLKGLKNQNSLNYNQELKISAAYTTDRSILFEFITSKNFIQNQISEHLSQNISNIDEEISSFEDSTNINPKKETTTEQEFNNILEYKFVKEEEEEEISVPPTKEINTPTEAFDVLNLGQPLEFNKNETHSFSEWLNLTSIKPINRKEANVPEEEKIDNKTKIKKNKKFELIDKFISANPKIDPTKSIQSKGNLAKAQMIQTESLMTETLARIYVEQKNYKSAIQSYKILSLKYPEKSSFFASQIEAVKQLQEQNNKL